jgi:signal transduction histidine kinase
MSLALKTLLALVAAVLLWRVTFGGAHIDREIEALALRQQGVVTALIGPQRQACERDPATWRLDLGLSIDGAAPALRLFAYDASLVSANPAAPSLEAELLQTTPVAPGVRRIAPRGEAPRYLMATPWGEGPCAFVLSEDRLELEGKPVARPPLFMLAAATLLVLFMVVRLRRLVGEIKAWETDPARPIAGSRSGDEIGRVARALQQATANAASHIARATRSEEALRKHLADVSHDLMVPLTVLMDRIYRLRTAPGFALEVGAVMQDAQYIANLVRSIESAARIESGQSLLSHGSLNLSEVVERVVCRHQTIAIQRGISLAHGLTPEAVIRGDALIVEQVVSNLVHNAVAYTIVGGHVAVVLEAPPEGGYLLRVADDGPGLGPEPFAAMLERGARGADSAAHHPLGKGLGLSIVKQAVASHGWRLSHRPLAPQGLEVSLWFGADDHLDP